MKGSFDKTATLLAFLTVEKAEFNARRKLCKTERQSETHAHAHAHAQKDIVAILMNPFNEFI